MTKITRWLEYAVRTKAADLIITAGSPPRIKIAGELSEIPGESVLRPEEVLAAAEMLIPPEGLKELKTELEWDGTLGIAGQRFRTNAFYQRGSLGLVLRRLPETIPTLDAINLHRHARLFCESPKGLILVTGPTGSGKSTTIAAMIDYINTTKAKHIITIEDPIEYLFKHKKSCVEQREVGRDTKSFARALRSALRQSPDVILIGELRDLETISIALTAAETGHLVFGTLHTNDAPQTVNRIIDVFPPEQQRQVKVQLASSLVGIVSQLLLPRADGNGLVATFEVLTATPAIRALIREGKVHQLRQAMEVGNKEGHILLEQHLAELVRAGIITVETAEGATTNPAELREIIGSKPKVLPAWLRNQGTT